MNCKDNDSSDEQSQKMMPFLWEQYRALRAEVIQRQTSDAAFEGTAVVGIATFYGWLFSRPEDIIIPAIAYYVPTVVAIFIIIRIWHSTQWFNNYSKFSRTIEKHLCGARDDMCWEVYLEKSEDVARGDRIRNITDGVFWVLIASSGPVISSIVTK